MTFTEEDIKRAQELGRDPQAEKALLEKGVLPQRYLNFLTNPDFFDELLNEISKKVSGERDTARALLLHMASVWVQNIEVKPHLFVNSESSAGKSYLVQKVSELFPESKKVYKTKMSNEAITYWKQREMKQGEWTWENKLLILNDPKNSLLNGDTFKVMLSEGSDAVVVRNQIAVELKMIGRPIVILTTASGQPNDEVTNRFNFVSLNETAEQTAEILKFQAKKASRSKLPEYQEDLKVALQFLKPINVQIPFAEHIAGCFPIQSLAVRRYFVRFLALIQASVAFHQFQRKEENGFFIAEKQDYELARIVLRKIATGENVFSLTHKPRKVYEACKKMECREFTISEALPHCSGICRTHCTLGKIFGILVQVGLFTCRPDDSGSKHRPAMMYCVKDSIALELPPFDRLQNDWNN